MPQLKNNFKLKNNLEVPKILKISLNIGLGSSKDDKNAMQNAVNELTTITLSLIHISEPTRPY